MPESLTQPIPGLDLSLIELLQTLIRFDTSNPPGNERECVFFIRELLTRTGFETEILARSPERPNLITRIPGAGNAPPILFYGHVDVVPAAAHPAGQGLLGVDLFHSEVPAIRAFQFDYLL